MRPACSAASGHAHAYLDVPGLLARSDLSARAVAAHREECLAALRFATLGQSALRR